MAGGARESAPPPSTITAILHRHDRIGPGERGGRPAWQRFERAAPNALWQFDFKGDFPLAAGRCSPLHVLDDHSRFVIGLVACPDQRTDTVEATLTALFARYELPWEVLCDNGPPWGSTQAERGLTRLGAWLERLGVAVAHGRPYHPQTQGKPERANRTLGEDLGRHATTLEAPPVPRYPDLPACQVAFDRWRTVYNQERPHEALGDATPSSRYVASPRAFPTEMPTMTYPASEAVRKVQVTGDIDFHGHRLPVSKALVGEHVALRPTADPAVWTVHSGTIHVPPSTSGRANGHRATAVTATARRRPRCTRCLRTGVTHVPGLNIPDKLWEGGPLRGDCAWSGGVDHPLPRRESPRCDPASNRGSPSTTNRAGCCRMCIGPAFAPSACSRCGCTGRSGGRCDSATA